jgi:hypothetical protein
VAAPVETVVVEAAGAVPAGVLPEGRPPSEHAAASGTRMTMERAVIREMVRDM